MLLKYILSQFPVITFYLINVVAANTYEDKRKESTKQTLTIIHGNEEKQYDASYIENNNRKNLPGLYQLFYDKNVDWCDSLPNTTKVPKYPNGWIALIPDDEDRDSKIEKRHCSCADKVKTAKKYNASAAIVLFSLCGIRNPDPEKPQLELTAITVLREYGLEIINIHEEGGPVVLCKISKPSKEKKTFRVSKTSVLFVLVSFILLMCISLAWLVFYYVQRFRHIYRNDRKEKQLLSAAKKAISKLKTAPFNASNFDGEDDSCAVCLENYKDGETIRILPCKHLFHKSCIDPWLLNHRTCPMCKNNILKSLGVEIPDNINLSHYDVDSRGTSMDEVVNSATPNPAIAAERDITNNPNPPVESQIPSTSAIAGEASSSQAWPEDHNIVSASVSSSTSSMLSDTDSERSTVALVSVQKV